MPDPAFVTLRDADGRFVNPDGEPPAGFGTSCGAAVAPAGNFEQATVSRPQGCGLAPFSSMSPDGTPANKGWNNIMVVFGQAPADDPEDFGEFRVACAKARFLKEEELKFPPSGLIEFKEEDFKKPANLKNPSDPEIFRASRDCFVPGNPLAQ